MNLPCDHAEPLNSSIVDDLVLLSEGDEERNRVETDNPVYRDVVRKLGIYPFIDNPLIFLGFRW